MRDELGQLQSQIDEADARIAKAAGELEPCHRLMAIPGVGPLTATAVVASIGNGAEFRKGRSFGIQAAAKAMKDGGRIILIGSNTAIRTAFPGASVYTMTKAALTGLVRGAAIDLAPRAITINNVQPGPTATEMSSPHAEMVKPFIPLRRMGEVREVASLVSYLASKESGFITGASLTIDGGYAA